MLPTTRIKPLTTYQRIVQSVVKNAGKRTTPLFTATSSTTATPNRESSGPKEKAPDLKLSKSSSVPSSSRLPSNREALEKDYPQWPRTWIPLASTQELDPDRPTPVEFLGQSYVTYCSNNSTSNNSSSQSSSLSSSWVVMDNTCSHRLAPLSEGRVDPTTRHLQCSYHGWTFDGKDGSCARIPQINPAQEAAALKNPRSCVPTYTTHVDPDAGILWIWPWQDDVLSFVGDEWRHPEGIMKNVFPNVNYDKTPQNSKEDTKGSKPTVSTYTRDQPYGWDTLVENLIDPAHIPFAHHGMQGSRADAIPINMTKATSSEAGFSFEWGDRTMGMMRSGTAEFRAPYLVSYNADFDGGSRKPFQLAVLCVPTKPGWSRVMVFSAPPAPDDEEAVDQSSSVQDPNLPKTMGDQLTGANPTTPVTTTTAEVTQSIKKKKKKKKKPSLVSFIFKNLPPWVSHLLSNKFFDSDMAFLHYQEQLRRPKVDGDNDSVEAIARLRGDTRYFMPSECDRSIAALHGWISQHAASYVLQQASQLPPAIYDRSQLFDHWGQHTSHCKICQNAMTGIKKWKRNSKIALVVSLIVGSLRRHWAPCVIGVLSFGVLNILGKIEGAFYKGEFKHYENH